MTPRLSPLGRSSLRQSSTRFSCTCGHLRVSYRQGTSRKAVLHHVVSRGRLFRGAPGYARRVTLCIGRARLDCGQPHCTLAPLCYHEKHQYSRCFPSMRFHSRVILIWFMSVVFGTIFFVAPNTSDAAILLKADYETGNFNQAPSGGWTSFCCSHSAQIVTSPVRGGSKAARYELRYADPKHDSARSERIYKGNSRIGKVGGPDEWYGFSIYLPPDYEIDDDPHRWKGLGKGEIVAQWHSTPDPGEISPSPPLALYTDLGKWKFTSVHSSNPILTSNNGTWVFLWEAPYQRGVWTDWVVHVKWSYQSNGFLEIWQNGKKVVDYKGPNSYNDKGNNYFQWGIYKAHWNKGPSHVTRRIIYNDELRIGDSTSSYNEVAPSGSPRQDDGNDNDDTTTPPPSTSFKIGDRVQTTTTVNVRGGAGLSQTLLGTQPTGSQGTITGGPTQADGYNWWNINYDTGTDGWTGENTLTKATAPASPQLCSRYPSNASAPSPYGLSWNWFTSAKELLLSATCSSSTTTVSIGKPNGTLPSNNAGLTYAWGKAYAYDGQSWNVDKPLSLTCSGTKISVADVSPEDSLPDYWCNGKLSGTLPSNSSFFVGYTCVNTGSAWQCGCTTTACTTSYWQLQGIQR